MAWADLHHVAVRYETDVEPCKSVENLLRSFNATEPHVYICVKSYNGKVSAWRRSVSCSHFCGRKRQEINHYVELKAT